MDNIESIGSLMEMVDKAESESKQDYMIDSMMGRYSLEFLFDAVVNQRLIPLDMTLKNLSGRFEEVSGRKPTIIGLERYLLKVIIRNRIDG